MGTVSPFNQKSHVLIDAGRCTGGDSPSIIGKWCFMVALVDKEGGVLHDFIGTDREAADRAAVAIARDFGIRIIDRSTEEPA